VIKHGWTLLELRTSKWHREILKVGADEHQRLIFGLERLAIVDLCWDDMLIEVLILAVSASCWQEF
jgi:hypothetical protein